MRTRSKSKSKCPEAETENDAPTPPWKPRGSSRTCRAMDLLGDNGDPKVSEDDSQDVGLERCNGIASLEGIDMGSVHCEPCEMDWEDGVIPVADTKEGKYESLKTGVTIEFPELLSPQDKPIRRATTEEKEIAEVVHKVHLLCLMGRGRLVDNACNDPLIQASLLSLLPSYLLKVSECSNLTANRVGSIVNWFCNNFRIGNQDHDRGSFNSNLAFALANREGTSEEVAALSVALFRALNLTTRFVSVLDVSSLKPYIDQSGDVNQNSPRLDTRILSSSRSFLSPSLKQDHLCSSLNNKEANAYKSSGTGSFHKGDGDSFLRKRLFKTSELDGMPSDSGGEPSPSQASCTNNSAMEPTEGSKRKGDLEFELQLEMACSATAAVVPDRSFDVAIEEKIGDELTNCSPFKRMRKSKAETAKVSDPGGGAVWSRRTGPPLYWAEVYCSGERPTGRWVHIDAINGIIDGEAQIESSLAAARRPLKYVVAFAGNGAKDVTRRYCMHWYKVTPQRANPDWWDSVIVPLTDLESGATNSTVNVETSLEAVESRVRNHCTKIDSKDSIEASTSQKSAGCLNPDDGHKQLHPSVNQGHRHPGVATRSSLEDMDLETRALTEPLPTTQLAYKNHHLYVIERWLTKHQVLYPKGPVLGYCSGHPVYPRSCVQNLQTKHRWLREGLQVKANQVPAKMVKRSKKPGSMEQASDTSVPEEDDGEENVELYGKWQMEPLNLPPAVNGIVPKNDRGQVDVWSEKCLPPGTVHLRLPRLVPIVKRLEIDFAPAMVGFDFRNGRAVPVFEGVVVCKELKDTVLEAYAEEEEKREAEERKRNEARALSRWFQLLSSIVTRQRLQNSYMESSSLNSREAPTKDRNSDSLVSHNESGGNFPSKETVQEPFQNNNPDSQCMVQHEHIYPLENQSFDEETFVRTKRCPCGFTIQVEEL